MKRLIIGASGLVGSYLSREFLTGKYDWDTRDTIVETYYCTPIDISWKKNLRSEFKLNIKNREETLNFFKMCSPDIVYLPASLTAVDYCEDNEELSCESNVLGVKNVVDGCMINNSKLIYFSSDYVFGSLNTSTIDEIPNPLNVYGKHKLLAEHLAL